MSATWMGGYPVSLLVDAWRKQGGSASTSGDILTLTLKDQLTGKTGVTRLQMHSETLPDVSDKCGPQSVVVERATVDGQKTPELDVQALVAEMTLKAAMELRPPAPKPVGSNAPKAVSSPPPPPVGTPVPPITPPPVGASWAPSPAANASSASPAPSGTRAGDDAPALGNCHMDSCSWSKPCSGWCVLCPGVACTP